MNEAIVHSEPLVELRRAHPDLAHQAAELLTVGFTGRGLEDGLKRLLDANVGGVVLFRRNIDTAQQVAQLISDIKAYAARPLFVAVDQEGGLVQRLRDGFTRFPPMRSVGLLEDAAVARAVGRVLGRELRAVGVDVNFAPVLDVDTNPNNPVIGSRSFSPKPEVVARLGIAVGQGLEESGVASCGKHFPGHGDTAQDSHTALPRLEHSWERLWEVELIPFRAWADAGLAAIMTAHVIFDAVEPHVPATMSHRVLQHLLRARLNYEGLVFSDDLEMRSVTDHFGFETAILGGLQAGVDNFLCCRSETVAFDLIAYLTRGVLEGRVDAQRWRNAREQTRAFAERWARPAEPPRLDQLQSEEGRLLVEEIERSAASESHIAEDPTEVLDAGLSFSEIDSQDEVKRFPV